MSELIELKEVANVKVAATSSSASSLSNNVQVMGVSEQTLRDYFSDQSRVSEYATRLAFKRIAEILGMLPESGRIEDVRWHELTASHFTELTYLWRDELSNASVRRYLTALRGLARMCFMNKSMDGSVYARIKEVSLPKGRNGTSGKFVERHYQKQLIDSCLEDDRVQGVRDAALLALLFGSGVRRAEAANLTEQNLDLSKAEFTVPVKGGNTETRFLSAWAVPYIAHWLEVKDEYGKGGGHVFVRIDKGNAITKDKLTGSGIMYLLEQRSIKAGLPFLMRPHDARRTLATEMIEQHGEFIAQRVLGHSDPSTTRIYDMREENVLRDIMSSRK